MMIRLTIGIIAMVSVLSVAMRQPSKKHPVILIPGFGGCRAYVRPKADPMAKPQLLWLNLLDFLTPGITTRQFRLRYNNKTHEVIDNEEFEVTFPGWGDTNSVEYLDPNEKLFSKNFNTIASSLRLDPFFISNVSLRGAPYDFRRSPKHNLRFIKKMKKLVENTYTINGNRTVVLVAHSMGTLYTHWFLNSQSQWWKKKYIEAYVSVSGPYGGTVKATRTMASGDNVGVTLYNPLLFREMQRSMPSLAFLLPSTKLWPANETIVITPKRNYTAHDMKQFFQDINYLDGYDMMKTTQMDFSRGPTGVKNVFCVYGTGLKTPAKVKYLPPSFIHGPFPDQRPITISGDGDGSVNLRSLEVCSHWQDVVHVPLVQAQHRKILHDERLINLIAKAAGAVIN